MGANEFEEHGRGAVTIHDDHHVGLIGSRRHQRDGSSAQRFSTTGSDEYEQ